RQRRVDTQNQCRFMLLLIQECYLTTRRPHLRPGKLVHPRLLLRLVSKKRCRVWPKLSSVLKRNVSTPARRNPRSSSPNRSLFVWANFARTEALIESSSSISPVSASSSANKPAGGNSLSRGSCKCKHTKSCRALVSPNSC